VLKPGLNGSTNALTNLSQVAAFICHLIDKRVFVLGTVISKPNRRASKNGSYTLQKPPPDDWREFAPLFKFGYIDRIKKLYPQAANIHFTLLGLVDFVLTGEIDGVEGGEKISGHHNLWATFKLDFDLDLCNRYIQLNKKPADLKSSTEGDIDGPALHEERPDKKFRETIFKYANYKNTYLYGESPVGVRGGLGSTVKTAIADADSVEVIERLDMMSRSLLEAAIFLRFQKYLVSLSIPYASKKKSTWKFQQVMNVLSTHGATKALPFYHPDFIDNLLRNDIDPDMKCFARRTYAHASDEHEAKVKAKKADKEKTTAKPSASVSVVATRAAFTHATDRCYNGVTRLANSKRVKIAEKREKVAALNLKSPPKPVRILNHPSKKKPKSPSKVTKKRKSPEDVASPSSTTRAASKQSKKAKALVESEEEASEVEPSGEEADPEGAKFAIFSNDEGGDGTDSDASGGESESS
jgi:hypothetical protein